MEGGAETRCASSGVRPIRRVALLPWGDLIGDVLAGVGLTLAEFREPPQRACRMNNVLGHNI